MRMHGVSFCPKEAVGDEAKKIEAFQSQLGQLMANTDNKMHQLEEVFEPERFRFDRETDSNVHSDSNSLNFETDVRMIEWM